MISDLINRPTFTLTQDDKEGGFPTEQPIQVIYWNGQVELTQAGKGILINNDNIKELFKAIIKNQPNED